LAEGTTGPERRSLAAVAAERIPSTSIVTSSSMLGDVESSGKDSDTGKRGFFEVEAHRVPDRNSGDENSVGGLCHLAFSSQLWFSLLKS
jgi:hypothetical protein